MGSRVADVVNAHFLRPENGGGFSMDPILGMSLIYAFPQWKPRRQRSDLIECPGQQSAKSLLSSCCRFREYTTLMTRRKLERGAISTLCNECVTGQNEGVFTVARQMR